MFELVDEESLARHALFDAETNLLKTDSLDVVDVESGSCSVSDLIVAWLLVGLDIVSLPAAGSSMWACIDWSLDCNAEVLAFWSSSSVGERALGDRERWSSSSAVSRSSLLGVGC